MYKLLLLTGKPGQPVYYDVMQFRDWNGLEPDEFLDIDWDFFACVDYPINTIDKQVEAFFSMELGSMPKQISACYSPNFSHPSRPQFGSFVDSLSKICQAKIIRLPHSAPLQQVQPVYKKYIPKSLYSLAYDIYYRINLRLRKKGIYL